MLYLIKSIKWTKHYKEVNYWGPNQCGYVTVIANAGFYEEKEAQDILRRSGENSVELVPVTKKILDKAHRQLRRIRKEIYSVREEEEIRHKQYMDRLNEREIANNNSFDLLDRIAAQLGI